MLLWRPLFFIVAISNSIYGAKILGVFFMDSYSHVILGQRMLKELAARGHEVTMVSPHAQKQPLQNYRDFELPEIREHVSKMLKETKAFDYGKIPILLSTIFVSQMGTKLTEVTLASKSVQTLLKSNETFDLVIIEQFLNDAHHGFAHHFKAPLIVLSSIGSSTWTNRKVGNVGLPSYAPALQSNFSPHMTFLERTLNTLYIAFEEIYMYFVHFPAHNYMLHQYFPDAPHIYDLICNTSLVFLNSHHSYNSPLPHLPNMIEIGGFHVDNSTELPENLKTFLDAATQGVVYFSLGSNVRSEDLPSNKRDALLKSFGKLKMKVLWKFEDDRLPGRPQNVRIEKWLPQPAVLAHPNVKLFITHGGQMSIIETVYHGVPVIGIPIFGDQHKNVAEAVHLGYGLRIQFSDVNEESLDAALKEMIENKKYTEVVKYRSHLLRNQPIQPIDNAVYWIEYVISHKGAPYLRSTALNLQWYQYFLMDVIGFLFLIAVISFMIIYFIVQKLLCRKKKPKHKKN